MVTLVTSLTGFLFPLPPSWAPPIHTGGSVSGEIAFWCCFTDDKVFTDCAAAENQVAEKLLALGGVADRERENEKVRDQNMPVHATKNKTRMVSGI